MKTKNWDALYAMNNELIGLAQRASHGGKNRKDAIKELEKCLPRVCQINKKILDDELKNFPQPSPPSVN